MCLKIVYFNLTSTSFSQQLMAQVLSAGMAWLDIVARMAVICTAQHQGDTRACTTTQCSWDHGNCIAGSDHLDINVFRLPLGSSGDYAHNLEHLVSSPSQQQWDLCKMETGITKLPLILGLEWSQSLRVPLCMTADLMHLASNLSDLLISLWHSMMECSHTDDKNLWDWAVLCDEDTWTAHGKGVENAGMFIPRSFDRKPCNIADKINADYKTWEFHLYIFGLAPVLLYSVLPEHYWINFCKLMHGMYSDHVSARYQQARPQAHLHPSLLLGLQVQAHLLPTQARLAPFHSPVCPPSSPPHHQDDAQGPTNLLCTMDDGTYHREPWPRNLAAIKTLWKSCWGRSVVI